MPFKQAVTSTFFLKATSLIIGFLLWSVISDSFTATMWVKAPLCFYNKIDQKITSSESLLVELKAKRSYLRNLDKQSLAIHVDSQKLQPGPNTLQITSDLLFLPPTIKVGEIVPHNILITVQET
ncbi:hypothetical protein H0X06_05410 [Candidatus Dependentiae bacterium]|nr:hypothetical protein [Candidatus Dependentiae bacterium]